MHFIIVGGTLGGVYLSNRLTKNCSKTIKYASGIFAGITTLRITGKIASYTAIPGRKDMNDAKSEFKTLDATFKTNVV